MPTFHTQVLHTFRRQADTNQRVAFDLDPSGRYLATGSTERRALVYDIQSQELVGCMDNQADAVGSVCFHPYAALMGVCTGQRHFALDKDDDSDSDDILNSVKPDTDGGRGGSSQLSRLQNGVSLYRIGRSISS